MSQSVSALYRRLPIFIAPLIMCMMVAASPAQAAKGGGAVSPPGKRLGLGLSLGWSAGLAGKYNLAKGQAVQFGLGVGGHSWLGANVDYIFTPASVPIADAGSLGFYAGGGLFAGIGATPAKFDLLPAPFIAFPVVAGVELPLGIVWNFSQLPIDIFLEVAPGIAILPGPFFTGRGAIGARFYLF